MTPSESPAPLLCAQTSGDRLDRGKVALAAKAEADEAVCSM